MPVMARSVESITIGGYHYYVIQVYVVHERKSDETLVWKLALTPRSPRRSRHKAIMRDFTDLELLPISHNNRVTGDHAEELTGLHMPAAMDRLRELVHESGG